MASTQNASAKKERARMNLMDIAARQKIDGSPVNRLPDHLKKRLIEEFELDPRGARPRLNSAEYNSKPQRHRKGQTMDPSVKSAFESSNNHLQESKTGRLEE